MTWLQRHRLSLYISNTIWVFPALSIVGGMVAVSLVTRFEAWMGWKAVISIDTARLIIGTVAASMFTLLVLVSSTVLVAVQLAAGQLTPRIIALVYRNGFRKAALANFAFIFTFSVGVLARLENSVPWLACYIAAYGFLLNLGLFIYFVDDVGKSLRPSSILRVIALMGREVIHSVYPQTLIDDGFASSGSAELAEEPLTRVVINELDGAVLAFDAKGLVSLATRSRCLIELIPEVGDYIAAGDPLFNIYLGGEDVSDEVLRASVAVGQERTVEQDPLYAFRIMVDIASRALSPAVNDPTTAVLAIDQIHHLLSDVGKRRLTGGCETDAGGTLRLVYPTPDWEDFVNLSITEIRQYGRDSIQVVRRLRAMIENLIATLPQRRIPLLQKELALLKTSSARNFPDIEDQTLALRGDRQGLGGSVRIPGDRLVRNEV